MTASAFLAFALLSLAAAISPGPAVMMAARTAVTEGLRTGVFLAVGIGAGAVVWASAALFGLAIVFTVAPALLIALKLVGGAYLLWMAWHLWRDAERPITDNGARPPRGALAAFRLGLVTQLANPKAAVMFSAIFVGTLPPQTPAWELVALLAVVFLNEALWNTLVARIFSLERTRTGYLRLKATIDRAFGGMLALLGLKIAVT